MRRWQQTWIGLVLIGTCAVTSAQSPGSGPASAVANAKPPLATRQMSFNIPFEVDKNGGEVSEVQLLVSADRGANWHIYSRQKPGKGNFYFRASRDGEYWFASKTVDAQNQVSPPGPTQSELHVLIDTAAPRITMQATVDPAGSVRTSWEIRDEHLDPHSFTLEYQGLSGEAWQAVAVDATAMSGDAGVLKGQVTWWPKPNSKVINLKCEVRDLAGNLGIVQKRLFLPATTARRPTTPSTPATAMPAASIPGRATDPFAPSFAPAESSPIASTVPPSVPPTSVPPTSVPSTSVPSTSFVPNATVSQTTVPQSSPAATLFANTPPTTSEPLNSVPANTNTVPTGANTANASYSNIPPTTALINPPPPATPSGTIPTSNSTQFPSQTALPPSATPPIATGPQYSPTPPARAPVSAALPNGERPRMTNSLRFALEYDIESAGPGGVADVELWGTADRGATWTRWGTDPDKKSPYDVEVPSEGIYGFRLVIVSKSNLASPAPQPGDLADIWVGVDVTAPQAELKSISYGEGSFAGQLDVRWEARDTLLGIRPVALYFSEKPDGPWTTIAAGLPNTGQYYWSIDARVPKRVFLRLEVRDEAGNVTRHQTPQVISLEGLTPAHE